jgi:hypothetical protein
MATEMLTWALDWNDYLFGYENDDMDFFEWILPEDMYADAMSFKTLDHYG